MLNPSTLPSTDRLRLLPSNLSAIYRENHNLKFFQNSSFLHRENPNIISKFFQNLSFQLPINARRNRLRIFCQRISSGDAAAETARPEAGGEEIVIDGVERQQMSVEFGSPSFSGPIAMCKMSLGDQAFFLLAFIACTTSIAFSSLVFAAVPTLFALKRAAASLAKLADTAREELPSTMTAIRLSGMEISDLTLELNDLSQEIADGVNKSAQAVQAAETGIRQIGALARQQTISMIQERVNLPEISLRPMVARAARKTSDAVGRATKKVINLLSRGEEDGEDVNSSESP